MNNNKLVINPDKNHLLVLGSSGRAGLRQQVSMVADNHVIKPTESEKLLIDQSLKWNQHIRDHKSSMIRQLTSRLNGLKKVSKNATFSTRLMVANGVVMSKLVYLITLWGGAQQYLLNALQVQQLTAARTVCGFYSRGWSKKKLLDKLSWMSIRQLIYYHTVLQAHKTIVSTKPASINLSISTQHPYRTRNAANGQIRFGKSYRAESDLVNASFNNRAVHWHNAVPARVRTGTLATVKHKLRMWVKQNVPIDWG